MNTVVELRQYTLHDGRREELIDIFERELVETQEAAGITLLGQFRDLSDPRKFVWLRGFPDMECRTEALHRFYDGPVWATHGRQAGATMIDSDDVLLLSPVAPFPGSPLGDVRAVLGAVCHGDEPFGEDFARFFDDRVRPLLAEAGGAPFACLRTKYAENTFTRLPVREGVHTFVWFSPFACLDDLEEHLGRLITSGEWRRVRHTLSPGSGGGPQFLRLAPTARSRFR